MPSAKDALQRALKRFNLTPAQQRRLWARSTTCKQLLTSVVFPELYMLRERVECLETELRDLRWDGGDYVPRRKPYLK